MMSMQNIYLTIPLICLLGSLIAGFGGHLVGRKGAHWVTILGVFVAFVLSVVVYRDVQAGNTFNGVVYTWALSGGISFDVGFLIDALTATMMVVVTFVSLMVHIYTIGYMHDDPGYQRFFAYISLFTFSMLMLVMSNNFLQLFFGWEAVGLVSYLLIGFWHERETAVFANMKAFLVNRVGDFGFLLGISAILYIFGSLDYAAVFSQADSIKTATVDTPFGEMLWITVICLLLFVGAMGKSAQVPLHVWLPDSMEGPTPISALIHAATMVTAGIFMVARMSPLFELSETALSFVLVIGATTAIFMALIGLVQNDIKRVVAYSTLSQLGYMTVALGASAYPVAIFHLGTHAFFKALLFLGAGSVIIAMHHEQDMRKMGGLKSIMPLTYITMVIGSLALAGMPPFAGFFSKDSIIEAVHASQIAGSSYAYWAVLLGVFVTAFYSFRLIFMTFHGNNRADDHTRKGLRESPGVVVWPLILLAIPSIIAGAMFFEPMLFGEFFKGSIYIAEGHNALEEMTSAHHGAQGISLILGSIAHGIKTPPFWLALSGIVFAWWCYIKQPELPGKIAARFAPVTRLLENKYWVDEFNQAVFANGAVILGKKLWKGVDAGLIDGVIVNGGANLIASFAGKLRQIQSGYIYHYAFAMMIGLVLLIAYAIWF
ncbi:MAG: NADH-quinone oxidoreductase subunit L [Proteobacteria bacterium]|nr:NADH-quinone oxidoreductase subunit L [Pseudomonadota bacterium]